MSNFSPPPTDGRDSCGDRCPDGQTCFFYNGGMACQPYQAPTVYPVTGANATVVNPPGWYLVESYPSLRYTGSLENQLQGASCTTIPVPTTYSAYSKLVLHLRFWDLGDIFTSLDRDYPSTLVQYRGNCAEGFFCLPDVPINLTANSSPVQRGVPRGELPGTCQPLRNESQPCLSTNMCQGWHVQADGSFNYDQVRCWPPTYPPADWKPSGTCVNVGLGKGVVDRNRISFNQMTRNMYLLAAGIVLLLLCLYVWYRRQKRRQQLLYMRNNPRDGGVYRPPDGTDNGELPAYGAHRRDERVIAVGSEEIGMYTYPNRGAPVPGRPVHQSYPFPMNYPGLNYAQSPMPTEPSGPISAQQAVTGVSIISQEAAALRRQEEGPRPPSYQLSSASMEPPSTQTAEEAAAVAAAVAAMTGNAMETTGTTEGTPLAGEKQGRDNTANSPHLPDNKEKPSSPKGQGGDQASTSSSGSASGSGSSIPGPNTKS